MNTQHLSDEAVAACADGFLTGHARGRAMRHIAECAECAAAVRGQREAVFALRAAPAPPLPTGLLDRLRGLPQVTPITGPPTVVDQDGTTMFSTLAPAAAFAAVADHPFAGGAFGDAGSASGRANRVRPFVTTTAAVIALTGILAAGSAYADRSDKPPREGTGTVVDGGAGARPGRGPAGGLAPDSMFTSVTLFRTGGN